jgi:hypothetical protein
MGGDKIMIKDFRDGNRDIIPMFRNEEKEHTFYYFNNDGSALPNNMTLICEVRTSADKELPDFNIPVTIDFDSDGIAFYKLTFLAATINDRVRENKLYWKVYTVMRYRNQVIRYGEIWLRSN